MKNPKTLQGKTLKRNPRIAWRLIGEEAVLVHLERNYYYTLDEVGTQIWQWIDSGISWDKLLKSAGEAYAAKPDRLKADIDAFLKQMLKEDVVHAA